MIQEEAFENRMIDLAVLRSFILSEFTEEEAELNNARFQPTLAEGTEAIDFFE